MAFRATLTLIALSLLTPDPVARAQSVYGSSDARTRGNRLVPRTAKSRQFRGTFRYQNDAAEEFDPALDAPPPPPSKKKKRGRTETVHREEGWRLFNEGLRALKQGQPAVAKQWFLKAEHAKYWPAKTQLFLGETELELGHQEEADRRFEAALATGEKAVEAPAYYYRGLIRTNIGQEPRAVLEFLKAERAFESYSNARTLKYRQFAEQALQYYRASHWYTSITLLGYYNSNISQLTLGEVSPLTLVGGLGTGGVLTSIYAAWNSAMAKPTQVSFENYASVNRNFNVQARNDEYLSDTFTLTTVFHPEETTSGGVRLLGNFVMRNNWAERQSDSFRMLDVGFDGGPFVRHRFGEQWTTEVGTFVRAHYNHAYEPASGNAIILNTITRTASYRWWWHPEYRLNYTQNLPREHESKTSVWGFGASNQFLFSDRNSLTLGIDYYLTNFYLTDYERADRTLFLKLTDTQMLSPSWSLVMEFSYSRNTSNFPELFNYNGASFSLGGVWSLN